jgi:curved DNA-binding protein CbpA
VSDNKITPESIPVLCEGRDLTTLEVDAREGFIISRMDGRTNVEHIISMSGMGREETVKILERLIERGIISMHTSHKPEQAKRPEKPERKPKHNPARSSPSTDAGKKRRFDQIPEGEAFFNWLHRLYQELDNIDYFELLGVDRKATLKDVKRAYFKRSKIFHPDRFYRKVDPDVHEKLKEIFKRTNTAFRILGDQDKRAEYEKEIKGKEGGVKISALTVAAKLEEEELKKKRPDLPKLSLDFDKDRKKEREQELLKKIKKSGMGEQIEKAQRFYQGAMLELKRKNVRAARTSIKLAMQYDPWNPKYKEALEQVDASEKQLKGEMSFEEGLAAEEGKDYDRAVRCFQEAARSDSQNPEYLYKLAESVLKYQKNYERARSLCIKAIELKEGQPMYHLVLGQAYKGMGQKQAARVQFEKVLQMEPKNRQASKELKAIKKS